MAAGSRLPIGEREHSTSKCTRQVQDKHTALGSCPTPSISTGTPSKGEQLPYPGQQRGGVLLQAEVLQLLLEELLLLRLLRDERARRRRQERALYSTPPAHSLLTL